MRGPSDTLASGAFRSPALASPEPPSRAAGLFNAARSANKDAMPYVFMFAAMLLLTMMVACVASV